MQRCARRKLRCPPAAPPPGLAIHVEVEALRKDRFEKTKTLTAEVSTCQGASILALRVGIGLPSILGQELLELCLAWIALASQENHVFALVHHLRRDHGCSSRDRHIVIQFDLQMAVVRQALTMTRIAERANLQTGQNGRQRDPGSLFRVARLTQPDNETEPKLQHNACMLHAQADFCFCSSELDTRRASIPFPKRMRR